MVDTFHDSGIDAKFAALKAVYLALISISSASSSVAGAVGLTTSGESESDDSEMGRLQGIRVVINLQFFPYLLAVYK